MILSFYISSQNKLKTVFPKKKFKTIITNLYKFKISKKYIGISLKNKRKRILAIKSNDITYRNVSDKIVKMKVLINRRRMEVRFNCNDQVRVIRLGKFHMRKLLHRVTSYTLVRNNREDSREVRIISYFCLRDVLIVFNIVALILPMIAFKKVKYFKP